MTESRKSQARICTVARTNSFSSKVLNVTRSRKVITSVALLLGVLLGVSILLAASPNEADWKQVQDAMNKGLPKTAIEKLDPIIEKATKSKNYDEAIKAIAMKISLEGDIPIEVEGI